MISTHCAPRVLITILLVAFSVTARGQQTAPRFKDPAPPTVQAAGAARAEAAVYPELRFHRAPKPLAEDAVTEEWPAFLGPRRDCHSRETGLLQKWPDGGPGLVWEMGRGEGFACPVIGGGRLCFTHREGRETHLDCLDPETGRRYWRYSWPCTYRPRYIKDAGPRAAPVIADGRVFVHGVQGRLHCLDLASGSLIWTRDTSKEFDAPEDFFGVVSSPIVRGDLLIQQIGAKKGPCVIALDAKTGGLVWGAGDRWSPSCASPVLGRVGGKERLFVLAGGESRPPKGGLMIIDPASGVVELEYPFRSRTFESVLGSSPVPGPDWVFLTAHYNVGSALLAVGPNGRFQERWKTRNPGLEFSNAVYEGGRLYAVDGKNDRAGAVICLDPATGEEIHRTDLDWEERVYYRGADKIVSFSVGAGSLLHADGRFLCLGDNGHLLSLEATPKGTRVLARTSLFRAPNSWTPLVLSRGLLYVCQNKPERFGRKPKPPRLLCFDLRGP